jgi:hypothetical protein
MRFFVWTYENQISHKFCMNQWSLVSLWCLLPTKNKCLNLCLSSSHFSIYDLEHPQWCSICNPTKTFLTSKFGYFLFPTSPIQLKLRLQIRERRLPTNSTISMSQNGLLSTIHWSVVQNWPTTIVWGTTK